VYQVATGLKKHDDAEKYLNRSRNWRNHWNPEQTSLGFSGFVVPRNTSGFLQTDPLADSGYWGDPYYEASSWAYSWASVHDMKEMVDRMGGEKTVVDRLNTMFTEGASGSSGMLFDPTNEP
jgi:putative alpha-1,2-mannosidase